LINTLNGIDQLLNKVTKVSNIIQYTSSIHILLDYQKILKSTINYLPIISYTFSGELLHGKAIFRHSCVVKYSPHLNDTGYLIHIINLCNDVDNQLYKSISTFNLEYLTQY
jgi:hypothetical protein